MLERDAKTGLYVGYASVRPDAHSQGLTVGKLKENLAEVISMLFEDGEPSLEPQIVGIHIVQAG